MPQTSVELVDGTGLRVIPVHKMSLPRENDLFDRRTPAVFPDNRANETLSVTG